ncbi:Similar to WBP4: WW domain-binding protein 4 (Gallus gallus) [Cotesia congregata]|uniref:Similar to WBP4: WW domain-binding protein 4 (Gallus gallus) n=1 Tax=Cotesia congregata TaxID=51543 RepID=A0A8J2MLE5_COTCN|nr:Similar to WBP4: WW domain-binding protein 4 (Gallus gallus) [Cotesia congregata]
MADYWQSQDRKFCDFCKCWIADNRASIDFHKNGKKHKESASKRVKMIYKNSTKQTKIQKKIECDLENMEKAALAAYIKDLEGNTVDITAQEIMKNKRNRIDEPIVVSPNQVPEVLSVRNSRLESSKNLPVDVVFCDPTTFYRAYRRDYSVPDRVDPYGPWTSVEIKSPKIVDLQLPAKRVIQVVTPVVKETRHWPVYQVVSEVYILVPALLGLKGNLEMTLASRLSTHANLGHMDTEKQQ